MYGSDDAGRREHSPFLASISGISLLMVSVRNVRLSAEETARIVYLAFYSPLWLQSVIRADWLNDRVYPLTYAPDSKARSIHIPRIQTAEEYGLFLST